MIVVAEAGASAERFRLRFSVYYSIFSAGAVAENHGTGRQDICS